MLISFLYGPVGIVLLTAFCLIGAFSAPQVAYRCMTPEAKKLLEEHGNIILLPRCTDDLQASNSLYSSICGLFLVYTSVRNQYHSIRFIVA